MSSRRAWCKAGLPGFHLLLTQQHGLAVLPILRVAAAWICIASNVDAIFANLAILAFRPLSSHGFSRIATVPTHVWLTQHCRAALLSAWRLLSQETGSLAIPKRVSCEGATLSEPRRPEQAKQYQKCQKSAKNGYGPLDCLVFYPPPGGRHQALGHDSRLNPSQVGSAVHKSRSHNRRNSDQKQPLFQ